MTVYQNILFAVNEEKYAWAISVKEYRQKLIAEIICNITRTLYSIRLNIWLCL